jgi:hypothetical protein
MKKPRRKKSHENIPLKRMKNKEGQTSVRTAGCGHFEYSEHTNCPQVLAHHVIVANSYQAYFRPTWQINSIFPSFYLNFLHTFKTQCS